MTSIEQQKERVRTLLTEVVSLFCKNTLMFDSELCIEGLIGITKDKTDLMLVSIKDIISSTPLPGHAKADGRSVDDYVSRSDNLNSPVEKDDKDSVVVVKVEHMQPVEAFDVDDSYSTGDMSVSRRHQKRHARRHQELEYAGATKKSCRNGDVAISYVEPTELQNTAINVQSDLSDIRVSIPFSSSLQLGSPRQSEPASQGADSNRSPELTNLRASDVPFWDVAAKFQCDICMRRFGVRQALEDHMQGVHLGTPRFLCPHCGKGFRFRSSLSYHKRKCLTNSEQAKSDPDRGWVYVSTNSQVALPGLSLQSAVTMAPSGGDSSQLAVFPTAEVAQQHLQEQTLVNDERERMQESLLQQLCSTAAEQQFLESEKTETAAADTASAMLNSGNVL